MFNPPVTRRHALGMSIGALVATGAAKIVRAGDETVLRVRLFNDIAVLDPAFIPTPAESLVNYLTLNWLVSFKSGDVFDWSMDAAESCVQKDPTHIEFKLKPGILWTNDYGEITADDVKFSIERVIDPKLASPYAGDWALLDHIEVVDKYSGVIVMKEPFAPLWYTALPNESGTILCKAAVEKLADQKFTTEPPAFSGPYVIDEWAPKQHVRLKRNKLWTGPRPAFDRVELLVITEDKSAELAYGAKELEATSIPISSVPFYKTTPPADGTLIVKPSLSYYWLGINVEDPTFKDIRVRQAVQYAVDVDAILQGAFSGQLERATGVVAPALPGYRPKNLIEKRDVEKAKALLAEAGKADGLSCKLTIESIEDSRLVAQIVQSNLAEVGITVEIEALDSGVFWGLDAEGQKKLQMTYKNYVNTPDPSWATMWFTPDQIGQWNWERFNDPHFAELHKSALRELDPKKRNDMYIEMQDLMEKSGAYIFVVFGANTVLYRNSVEPAFAPNLLKWNLREWKPA